MGRGPYALGQRIRLRRPTATKCTSDIRTLPDLPSSTLLDPPRPPEAVSKVDLEAPGPSPRDPSWAAEEVSRGGLRRVEERGSGRVRTSELHFVALLLETSNLHNSAFIPPAETLDPSLGSSLRALPASTRYHPP